MDLTGPWLLPLQPALGQAWGAWQGGATVADALNARLPADPAAAALAAGPLHFVPQAALPDDEAYEAFIHRTARVPTRDNLHDFFNGLVWLTQPALKRRLNALQAAAIARDGVQPRRGPLRDALTLFDENGAWWQAPGELMQALQRRDWHALFVTQRALWPQARLTVVGHALLEKLVHPRKAITAHLWVSPDEVVDVNGITAASWSAKPFLPLPVLGVPGWWPANENPGFYDDADVFRPARG